MGAKAPGFFAIPNGKRTAPFCQLSTGEKQGESPVCRKKSGKTWTFLYLVDSFCAIMTAKACRGFSAGARDALAEDSCPAWRNGPPTSQKEGIPMKALRFALSLLCWTLLFSLWGAAAQAAGFAPALTVEEGRGKPGGVVEVAFPYDGSLGEVAAFRTQVEYDPTVLEYLRPTYGESVQAGTVTTQNTPGKVASVYTAPAGGPYLAAEDAIIYRFRILESAVPGLATVFASAFELSTPEPAAIPEDVDVSLSFQVLEPPSSDARLLSLAPDHGQLQPAFDPDVFAYTMTVPYEVEAVTFTAEPVPGAACRVNRKNLGSGGSDTLFRITVTAEDGETKNEYHVTVHRQEKEEEEKPELNSDASLLSLTPASGTLTPAFDPDVYEYSLTVPFEVTTMTFTAEVPEGATYRVNRKNLGAGGSDTLFRITVTAEDGETKNEYHVTVHRQEKEEEEKPELNSDASLLSLTPASGTLTPAFDPDVYEYSLTVPFEVTTMTFTAEAPEGATYRVNRKNLGAGGSDTLFRITVTAEDGETKKEYHVTVHRQEKEEEEKPELSADASLLSLTPASGTLTPAFDPDVYEYSLTVPFEVTTMTFTAEVPEGATYRVNRKNLGAGGSDTLFRITVTAEDGETKKEYHVTVHRQEKEEEEKPELSADASLLSLTPASGTLTPAFDPDVYEYSLTVPFEVTTMTFTAETPAGATYRVNRKNLGAGGSDTLFRITVTAEDGETKSEYQVTVYRSEKEEEEKPELSADASLLSLTPATGNLTPAFDPEIYQYNLTVPFEVTTMTFTAEVPEGAAYRVNRKNLGAGGSDTVFEITVTAADGETRQVYTVTVHRSEKAVSTGGAGTGSGSSGGGSASQSSGDGDSDTSSGGTEASPERESTEGTVPVAGGVGESSSPGGGEGDASPEGSASGGLVFQNGETSRLPALLVLVAFILFCFLSGPLAKMLAKRFPQKEEPTGK